MTTQNPQRARGKPPGGRKIVIDSGRALAASVPPPLPDMVTPGTTPDITAALAALAPLLEVAARTQAGQAPAPQLPPAEQEEYDEEDTDDPDAPPLPDESPPVAPARPAPSRTPQAQGRAPATAEASQARTMMDQLELSYRTIESRMLVLQEEVSQVRPKLAQDEATLRAYQDALFCINQQHVALGQIAGQHSGVS